MITKQLQLGTTDPEVKELQKFLNSIGIKIAETGAGSPGNETDYFGPATQAAVQKFQAQNGIVISGTAETTGYGRVGPQTLTKIQSMGKEAGQPAAANQPAQQNQQASQTTSWNLSAWQMDNTGGWKTQPTLTINGKNYTYNTPEEYITKLNELKSIPGMTGPLDQFIGEFNNAITWKKQNITTNAQTQIAETEKKLAEAKNVLEQAQALGYAADQEIRIDATTGKVLPPNTSVGTSGTTYKIPDWLASNDYFKQLSPDEQEYVVNYYNIVTLNETENQDRLKKALTDAQAAADPYFKEKIRVAQDELLTALGEQSSDFESQRKSLEQKISDIKTDLATGKERLSVDQQAELARQAGKYEVSLENLLENAATSGLTFSSRRAVAESRLATEQTDVVESTKRDFQRKIEDLQTQASRGDRDAQAQLADYERLYGENVTKLGRAAEATLGTANLPTSDLKGYSPLGSVVGTLEEEKLKDITQRAEALANLRNPFI